MIVQGMPRFTGTPAVQQPNAWAHGVAVEIVCFFTPSFRSIENLAKAKAAIINPFLFAKTFVFLPGGIRCVRASKKSYGRLPLLPQLRRREARWSADG